MAIESCDSIASISWEAGHVNYKAHTVSHINLSECMCCFQFAGCCADVAYLGLVGFETLAGLRCNSTFLCACSEWSFLLILSTSNITHVT